MSGPQRFLTRMIAFLVLVILIAGGLYVPLSQAFMASPAFNGVILGVFVIGAVFVFRQVLLLRPEVSWIERFKRTEAGLTMPDSPQLLAPMAAMLGDRSGKRMSLSAQATRSMLDGIASRLDESREIARYIIGLLIFLGLLGTFYGLMGTISAVGSTINNLGVDGGDFAQQFSRLKDGLSTPLTGMGTAFSASLFGLSGSLVLGFLELQAGQAQNRFYNDLEEWLSSVTRISGSGTLGDADQSVPAYVQALLEQTAESLDNLQRTLAGAEEARGTTYQTMRSLTEKLATLTDQMRSEQDLLVKLVEGQLELRPVLQRLADGKIDQASQMHLRNIDVHLGQMVEQTSRGQDKMVQELRSELKLLARTIGAALTPTRRE
ncbi:MAG: flagellar motor protein MotA [Alphaproteobacteria bacterium]|nr:flagellar motor protein MotA [Alphaproteobacteria bacterium]